MSTDVNRTAEDHSAGVVVHGFRQGVAEARPPHVQRIAEPCQHLADAAGRGMLLVQDEQDGLEHGGPCANSALRP